MLVKPLVPRTSLNVISYSPKNEQYLCQVKKGDVIHMFKNRYEFRTTETVKVLYTLPTQPSEFFTLRVWSFC